MNKGGYVLKVTIIKGPMYAEREKQAHELLYKIISKKVNNESSTKKVS